MSQLANAIPSQAAGPAARALRKADDGIGNWLSGLISGSGSSPSQIIITGILGVVPGVGQVMDVRDLVLGIIAVSRAPTASEGWVTLAITLVGCIPAVGDACKVGFTLMRKGHNFGRVLEAVSPTLRGNVERFMRQIDWSMLARESIRLFEKSMAAFIDGMDTWIVKAMTGKAEANMVVDELKALRQRGPQMIHSAFAELKQWHAKMMGHELSGSTAAVGATTTRVAREDAQVAAKAATSTPAKSPLAKRQSRDLENQASPNATKTDQKKSAKKQSSRNRNGVLAEHLTDYYVNRKHATHRKINENGRLTEENDKNRTGIDHVWHDTRNTTRPYVVADTKSSLFDSLGLIQALPAEMRAQFDALRVEEKASPLPNKNPDKPANPNIFASEKRDGLANQHAAISSDKEDVIRRGVNRPNEKTGLPTQMSHAWIAQTLRRENLTADGEKIHEEMEKYIRNRELNAAVGAPYARWISLVTGRQFEMHRKSKGARHDIQIILDLPDNILKR